MYTCYIENMAHIALQIFKNKKFGQESGKGKMVGTWKVTRDQLDLEHSENSKRNSKSNQNKISRYDPKKTLWWSCQFFYGENSPILGLR
jgi:hypothetical protein